MGPPRMVTFRVDGITCSRTIKYNKARREGSVSGASYIRGPKDHIKIRILIWYSMVYYNNSIVYYSTVYYGMVYYSMVEYKHKDPTNHGF